MPWNVKKNGDKWCVYKKGASKPIPGGCHDTESEARDHQKALYANESGAAAALANGSPSLVTIPNVPLIEVGMDWPAMTGGITFTREDLVDAVTAANEDPTIPSPRLKLTLVNDTHGTPITEPSFGRVTGLRFDEDDQTVYGDYEGVPEWLAEILPAAYPSRSIEAYHGVTTVSGGKWSCVIGAIQLLGVEWPGCMSLEDLPLYYGKSKPKTVTLNLAKGGEQVAKKLSVNVDDVRRAYYEKLKEEGNYSWWCKAVLLEPNQLVVEDEYEGELYLVNFKIDEADSSISFSDPKQVQIKYVPVPKTKEAKVAASSYLVAGLEQGGREVLASYATAEESGRVIRPEEGDESMNDEQRKKLAAGLGLPESATQEEIQKKLLANALEEPEDDDDGGESDDDGEGTEGNEGADDGAEARQPVVSHSAADTVTLDKATYEQLKSGAEDGRAARAEQVKTEDSIFLTAALKAGKFPPARLGHWETYMKQDRAGARAAIDALAPGLVPVEERGTQQPDEMAMQKDAYPENWFPEVAARKARLAHEAQQGGPRIYSERVA